MIPPICFLAFLTTIRLAAWPTLICFEGWLTYRAAGRTTVQSGRGLQLAGSASVLGSPILHLVPDVTKLRLAKARVSQSPHNGGRHELIIHQHDY